MSNEDLEAQMELLRQRKRTKKSTTYLDLQSSERAVLDAASRIYGAWIAAGAVSPGQERRCIAKAVGDGATQLGLTQSVVNDVEEPRSEFE